MFLLSCFPFTAVPVLCGIVLCPTWTERRFNRLKLYVMQHDRHIFSESAAWKTESVFITPDGVRHEGMGESHVTIKERKIVNRSWITAHVEMQNDYRINHLEGNRYLCRSDNGLLGTQYGWMDIHYNTIFSKFEFENSEYNGYEIITRDGDVCRVSGALYRGNQLENTWTAVMRKMAE